MTHHPGLPVTKIAVQDRRRLYREGVAPVPGVEPDVEVVAAATAAEPLPARACQAGVRSVFPSDAGIRTLLPTLPSPGSTVAPTRVVNLDERRPFLSRREVEVLCEVSAGFPSRVVDTSMGSRPERVENQAQPMFSKLGVQDEAHGAQVAIRCGLLVPAHRGPPPVPAA